MKLLDIKTSSLTVDVKQKDAVARFFKLIDRKKENYDLGTDVDKIVVYIVLMYDPKSPMIEAIDGYWERKFEALDTAGFRQKNGKFVDDAENIAMGRMSDVNDLIIDYLVCIAKPQWSHIVFLNESLIKYTKQATTDKMAASDIKAVSDIYEKLGKAVRDWTSANSDDTSAFLDRLYYKSAQELIRLRPEAYAKRIINGDELNEDSPYGSKYKVKKPKFAGSKIPKDGE